MKLLRATASPLPLLTYLNTYVDSVNRSTYNFTVDLLYPKSDRIIVVGIAAQRASGSTPTISSVTVSGSSLAVVNDGGGAASTTNGSNTAALWSGSVTSGTTGLTASIVFGQGQSNCGIALWELHRLVNSGTPTDSAASTASAPTATLTTVNGGCAIGFAHNSDSLTWTWTNLTENSDTLLEGQQMTGASALTTGTSLTVTATVSAPNDQCGAFASFA